MLRPFLQPVTGPNDQLDSASYPVGYVLEWKARTACLVKMNGTDSSELHAVLMRFLKAPDQPLAWFNRLPALASQFLTASDLVTELGINVINGEHDIKPFVEQAGWGHTRKFYRLVCNALIPGLNNKTTIGQFQVALAAYLREQYKGEPFDVAAHIASVKGENQAAGANSSVTSPTTETECWKLIEADLQSLRNANTWSTDKLSTLKRTNATLLTCMKLVCLDDVACLTSV